MKSLKERKIIENSLGNGICSVLLVKKKKEKKNNDGQMWNSLPHSIGISKVKGLQKWIELLLVGIKSPFVVRSLHTILFYWTYVCPIRINRYWTDEKWHSIKMHKRTTEHSKFYATYWYDLVRIQWSMKSIKKICYFFRLLFYWCK